MSFILDALKKIEQEKRRGEGPGSVEGFAVARQGPTRMRLAISMGAIALGSAVVTALVLSTFRGEPEAVQPEPTAESASVALSDVVAPVERVTPEVDETPPPVAEETREPTESAFAPSGSTREVATTKSPLVGEKPPVDEPPVEEAPAEEPAVEAEAVEAEEPPESVSSAIRLVGRERAARGIQEDEASRPEAGEDREPPQDLPELVLQGTSVIGDQPVAVISDQRVFEGDRIQGALVVRIEEREVELELDGRRFILRL